MKDYDFRIEIFIRYQIHHIFKRFFGRKNNHFSFFRNYFNLAPAFKFVIFCPVSRNPQT